MREFARRNAVATVKPSSNIGSGIFMSLFGLMFLGAGLLLVYPPLYAGIWPHQRDLLIDHAAALLFCCSAGIFSASISVAMKPVADPARPYLADPDWTMGRIYGRGGWGTLRRRWTMALVIAYFSSATVWMFVTNYDRVDDVPLVYRAFLEVIIPAWALFLLLRTITATAQMLRYGQSCLILENGIPGPGTAFSARIDCHVDQQLEPTFVVSLVCYEAITSTSRARNSSSSSTDYFERWRDEYDCAGLRDTTAAAGCSVPVRFDLPLDALTTSRSAADRVQWILSISSTLPGFTFEDRFAVPVFSGAAPVASELRGLPERREVLRQPAQGRVVLVTDGDTLRVTYPPGMESGKALFATYCLVMSLIIAQMCRHAHAGLALVACVLVAACSGYYAVRLWLITTTVIARPGSIVLRREMPGRSREREISVTPESRCAIRQQVTNDDTSFYLSLYDGRSWTKIGSVLEHRSEAMAILDRIIKASGILIGEESIGVQASATPVPAPDSPNVVPAGTETTASRTD